MADLRNIKDHYDMIVIGAGPAGSNFSRLAANSERDILIIDGSDGHSKVCGGLISPDAQDILARCDISLPNSVLASPQLFSVRTIDLADGLTRYYRRNYVNVDRNAFDRFMFGMIPDSVDKLCARCNEVKKLKSGFELKLIREGEEKKVTCSYIIGADGASSIVRRSLFKNKKIHKYTAIQQWFEAECENPFYSCVFDSATSSGCSWIFFKDGKLIFGGAFEFQKSREAFEAQKAKLIKLGIIEADILSSPVKTEACLVSRPHFLHGIFRGGNGAFLLGEAAGFISPSSFEGISYALSSAEALADAFTRGSNAKSVMRIYNKQTRPLELKIKLRCLKRPFMYDPALRSAVMRSGLTSIKIKNKTTGGNYESKITLKQA